MVAQIQGDTDHSGDKHISYSGGTVVINILYSGDKHILYSGNKHIFYSGGTVVIQSL